jgi:hypothetical protein
VPAAARADDPGFTTIFDGTATGSPYSLDHWLHAGAGSVALQPDGSLLTSGGPGLLWYPDAAYGDFVYRVDYKGADVDGGALVRFPDLRVPPTGSDACADAGTGQVEYASRCGQEIQILDGTAGDASKTGSVHGFADLDAAASHLGDRAAGDWHTLEVRVVGQQYTVAVDGRVVNQYDNGIPESSSRAGEPPSTARQLATGYLGLQNHADGLAYRAPRVKALAAPPRNTSLPVVTGDPYVGSTLDCWPGTWSNVDAQQTYDIAWLRGDPPPAGTAPTGAEQVGSGRTYVSTAADAGRILWCRVTATNAEGGTAWATRPSRAISYLFVCTCSSVPAQFSLALGAPASFGALTPGVTHDYLASTTAEVVSTVGDWALSVSDSSANATGHLVNGASALPSALQATASGYGGTPPFADVAGSASPTRVWTSPGPYAYEHPAMTLSFRQHVDATDALRAGSYSKTVTFTLSTTTP